jgi:hypothetical protein
MGCESNTGCLSKRQKPENTALQTVCRLCKPRSAAFGRGFERLVKARETDLRAHQYQSKAEG